MDALITLLHDTIYVDEDTGLIESVQEQNCPFDVFVKITEGNVSISYNSSKFDKNS